MEISTRDEECQITYPFYFPARNLFLHVRLSRGSRLTPGHPSILPWICQWAVLTGAELKNRILHRLEIHLRELEGETRWPVPAVPHLFSLPEL
jgi:hypothetical protein